MRQTAVGMMVLSGLCLLPACFPHTYILVEKAFTWNEALSYCRSRYTDLASVHNEHDFAKFSELIEKRQSVWIGLHPDRESWRWSLENQDYYGEGEAEFRMWDNNQPNGGHLHKLCAGMAANGKWNDLPCSQTNFFFCYDERTSNIIYVRESKTWGEAQSYCRERHTDLASVRNQAENDQMRRMIAVNAFTWIGLYRDTWKWTDGSVYSFNNWALDKPGLENSDICGVSIQRQWVNAMCGMRWHFVCYGAVKERRVVKVVLKKPDTSVDMEELQEAILEKFNQRVKELGMSGDVELRWVKQPDGKIFHKQDEEEDEGSCPVQKTF